MANEERCTETMMSFPPQALAMLRELRWSPDAERTYDMWSDGYVWNDEFPPEVIAACRGGRSWAFRTVLSYRGSLIRGEPRDELRPPWDQLGGEAPDWPGFRPERRSSELKERLEKDAARMLRYIDRVNRVLNRER